MSPQTPRAGRISPSVSVVWSNGAPFTGYYLFQLTQPSNSDGPWGELDANTTMPGTTIPKFTLFPIVNGTPNASCGLIYNADIDPPGTQYTAYLYDSGRRKIVGPTSDFIVSTPFFTPPTLTGAIPTTFILTPTPDTFHAPYAATPATTNFTMLQHATYTPDGITLTFTLATNANILLVVWNGVVMMNGIGYTFTQGSSTFSMAGGANYTPQVGDTLEAYWQ